MEQFETRLFESAASGKTDEVASLLRGAADVNSKNERGWTALMFAARNGQTTVIEVLMQNRCDPDIINSTGQTALDIAIFWNHKAVIDVLKIKNGDQENGAVYKPANVKNFFSHYPLDRAGNKRRDADWVSEKMKENKTKFVVLSNLRPFLMTNTTSKRGNYKICAVDFPSISAFIKDDSEVVFLGLEDDKYNVNYKIAWFALDVGDLTEDEEKKLSPQGMILDGHPARSLMQISEVDAAILAQARSMLAWHDRYRFCATCGATTKMAEAGYKRECSVKDCRSNKGVNNTSYPRTDPVVIMVTISKDRKHCLLGRGAKHPKGMYSCLAGFMEPGETIEDAVRREVFEESGIRVGRVDYHSCQPWPMPSSLMIGCLAYATSTEIVVDKEEIDDARWFDRQEVVQMLTHQHKNGIFVPPDQAIAHQLIRAWVTMTANL